MRIPTLICIDANRSGVVRADGCNGFDLRRVISDTELHFENGMVGNFGNFGKRRLRIGNADGKGGYGCVSWINTEQLVERKARAFTKEIVESEIQRATSGGGNLLGEDAFERVRCFGELIV